MTTAKEIAIKLERRKPEKKGHYVIVQRRDNKGKLYTVDKFGPFDTVSQAWGEYHAQKVEHPESAGYIIPMPYYRAHNQRSHKRKRSHSLYR